LIIKTNSRLYFLIIIVLRGQLDYEKNEVYNYLLKSLFLQTKL
jgi:hypothetical protein